MLRLGTTISTGTVNVVGNDATVACTSADFCVVVASAGFSDPIYRCVRGQSWATANTTCAGLGMGATGKLLWLTGDADWATLQTLASTRGGGWFGLTDASVEGTWIASDSSVMYSPTSRADFWAIGAPNGGTNENCAQLYDNGRANDLVCAVALPFYCRVP